MPSYIDNWPSKLVSRIDQFYIFVLYNKLALYRARIRLIGITFNAPCEKRHKKKHDHTLQEGNIIASVRSD